MKRFLKLFPLTLLFCLALALGLTACGGKRYSVTAEYDHAAGSVVFSEEGKSADGKYQEGASVTVTVTPNAGYDVATFTVNGTAAALSGNAYTFTVKEDTEISVTFVVAYAVTLEKDFDEAAGAAVLSAPQSGGAKYAKDELVTLTVTINDNYFAEKITVGDEEIELNEDGKYSFKVKADTAVKVSLREMRYCKVTLVCEESDGRLTVTPDADADGAYRAGTKLTLHVIARHGHGLLAVTVNDEEVTLDEKGEYSFTIHEDVEVEATFEEFAFYNIVFHFDTEMCSMSYLGENEELNEGDISIQPEVATKFYAGETVFTVTPAGGYEIVDVLLNGEKLTLTEERSFTLDVGESLQDEKGEIHIAVVCGFYFIQLDSLAGEYELTDDVWYSFTLEESAVFEFSASNYIAYAAFYAMTQTGSSEDGSEWEAGDEPVWLFNNDGRSNYAIHTFEAGSYIVRFSASTGDGAASSKLTVTKIETSDLELPEAYIGAWKSTDGHYTMAIGKNYLVLKKDGVTLDATLSTDEEFGDLYISFEQSEYLVMLYANCVPGTISFVSEEEGSAADVLFLPDPLPTVTVPEEIYGVYGGIDEEENPVDDLTIAGGSIVWGNKTFTPLTEIGLHGITDPALLSYTDEEGVTHYYVFFCNMIEGAYQIIISEGAELKNQMLFTRKGEITEKTLGQEYWGKWDSGVYELEITATSVTLTKNGQEIEVKVGTHKRTFGEEGTPQTVREYVSFTFDGGSYYLLSAPGRGKMPLYSTSSDTLAMTFSAKYTLTVTSPNATVNFVSKKDTYRYNDNIHFSVVPAAGYILVAVKVNGEEIKMGEDDTDYHFYIQADSVLTVECTPIASAASEPSPVAFDDELVGTWQGSDLKITIEKNSVALSDGAGNPLPHSLRAETYRGSKYNAVVLGETCYLFLKANGT